MRTNTFTWESPPPTVQGLAGLGVPENTIYCSGMRRVTRTNTFTREARPESENTSKSRLTVQGLGG